MEADSAGGYWHSTSWSASLYSRVLWQIRAYIAGLAVRRLVGAVTLTVRLLLVGLRPNVVGLPSWTRLLLSVPIWLLWLLRLLVSFFDEAKCITNDSTVSLTIGTSALAVFFSISEVVLLVRHVWKVDELNYTMKGGKRSPGRLCTWLIRCYAS
jgi:hypothetical protein